MQSFVKTYSELTKDELYALLQLRSEVFVVEQDCIYQDIDGKDQKALHVLGFKENQLIAYTRVFKPGDYFKQASIGQAVKQYFNEITIKISAQCYLKKFYNSLGFKEVGEEYLEDGIPHIAMLLN